MKNEHTAGTRYDARTDQYVPTLNGKDISPTSFEKARALEIARQAADLAHGADLAEEKGA